MTVIESKRHRIEGQSRAARALSASDLRNETAGFLRQSGRMGAVNGCCDEAPALTRRERTAFCRLRSVGDSSGDDNPETSVQTPELMIPAANTHLPIVFASTVAFHIFENGKHRPRRDVQLCGDLTT